MQFSRPMDLSGYNVVVVVFAMKGCPACADYEPRIRAAAQRYAPWVPTLVLDANDQHHDSMCTLYGVKFTPTTLILRRPTGVLKWESALSDQEIDAVYQTALRAAQGG